MLITYSIGPKSDKLSNIIRRVIPTSLVINVPEERSSRRAFIPRARNNHVCTDPIARDTVHLVVDKLLRRVELRSRLPIDGVDIAAFDGGSAFDVRDGIAIREVCAVEACDVAQLADGGLGCDTVRVIC